MERTREDIDRLIKYVRSNLSPISKTEDSYTFCKSKEKIHWPDKQDANSDTNEEHQ